MLAKEFVSRVEFTFAIAEQHENYFTDLVDEHHKLTEQLTEILGEATVLWGSDWVDSTFKQINTDLFAITLGKNVLIDAELNREQLVEQVRVNICALIDRVRGYVRHPQVEDERRP